MILVTAKLHFDQDISRSRELLAHANAMPARTAPERALRDDVLRAAWMMAVGACDAYFSDAYADLLSRVLRAKELQPAVAIPDRLSNLKVPAIAMLRRTPRAGWRWRMVARELIEDENVLSLDKIRQLFKRFFRDGNQLLVQRTIGPWITHPSARQRLFGVTATRYRSMTTARQRAARQKALGRFEQRFEKIFQRRHDCIHNCDRPKMAIQSISTTKVAKCIQDIELLVNRCTDAFRGELPQYLANLGFSGATRNRVGA